MELRAWDFLLFRLAIEYSNRISNVNIQTNRRRLGGCIATMCLLFFFRFYFHIPSTLLLSSLILMEKY